MTLDRLRLVRLAGRRIKAGFSEVIKRKSKMYMASPDCPDCIPLTCHRQDRYDGGRIWEKLCGFSVLDIGDMAKGIPIFLNCARNMILAMPPAVRKAEALREVKMVIVPRISRHDILDTNIPGILVSEEMAERYLEITPPVFSIMPDYQSVIQEIEQSYVIGNDFSAISASCVVIERLLNQARIALHKHHKIIKRLWDKGPTNDWDSNIVALKEWDYLDDTFASELSNMYHKVRCRYLHCGEIQSLRNDARRSIAAAYKLMTIFIGFPEDLFSWVAGCVRRNPGRFRRPHARLSNRCSTGRYGRGRPRPSSLRHWSCPTACRGL